VGLRDVATIPGTVLVTRASGGPCDPPRRPKVQLTVSEAILAMGPHMVKGDVKYFPNLSFVISHFSIVICHLALGFANRLVNYRAPLTSDQ